MVRKKNNRATTQMWEDPTTQYNPEAPAVQSALKSERWKRWWIKASIFVVTPVLALTALMQFARPDADGQAATSIQVNSSEGKATANQALHAWLNSDPSPFPGGEVVSWDGYTTVEPPAEMTKDTSRPVTYRFETHRFTLIRAGQTFRADVQVAVDDLVGATATGTPTIRPLVDTPIRGQAVAWFGFDNAEPAEPVKRAVADWAEAYVSGDGDRIRRIVRDPSSTNWYVPIAGVANVSDVRVVAGANIPGARPEDLPTSMLVRVEVAWWWSDHEPVPDENGNISAKRPQPATFDLLVNDTNTASPYVVAWGPTGSGPTLVPYQNAISGVEVKPATPTPAEPAPATDGAEELPPAEGGE